MPHFNRPAKMQFRGTRMVITRRFIGSHVRQNYIDLLMVTPPTASRLRRLFHADIWTHSNVALSRELITGEDREYKMLGRMGVNDYTYLNENGVEGTTKEGGGFLPRCCATCPLYSGTEYADDTFGSVWASGYCSRGVLPPTRTGLCEVKRKYLELPTTERPPYLGRQGARE